MYACLWRCSGGLVGSSKDKVQTLILGLDGVGKTTLLYKLRLPKWKDIVDDVAKMREEDDFGYHYEEFSNPFRMGVFDVPGTPAMQHVWKYFYQAIMIHCVIFVVNSNDDEERLKIARQHLHRLMNEEELHLSCFAVIINKRDEYVERELKYSLGLDESELHSTCVQRVKLFDVDIKEMKDGVWDPQWKEVMQHIKAVVESPDSFEMNL